MSRCVELGTTSPQSCRTCSKAIRARKKDGKPYPPTNSATLFCALRVPANRRHAFVERGGFFVVDENFAPGWLDTVACEGFPKAIPEIPARDRLGQESSLSRKINRGACASSGSAIWMAINYACSMTSRGSFLHLMALCCLGTHEFAGPLHPLCCANSRTIVTPRLDRSRPKPRRSSAQLYVSSKT